MWYGQGDDGRMETTDTVVRTAGARDVDALNEIYNHYVATTHVTFDVEPMSRERRRDWLTAHEGGRHRVLVATADDRVVGYAASGPYRERPAYDTTVETSVYVVPACAGRGVATSLYTTLFEALADEDVHRAVAGIAQPNEPSVALHRRFGFERVAHFSEQGRKFGRYWDVDWFERSR
jgi:phosphinothricin acetyltransferase